MNFFLGLAKLRLHFTQILFENVIPRTKFVTIDQSNALAIPELVQYFWSPEKTGILVPRKVMSP